MRRWSLGLTLSVALHAAAVGTVVGLALLRGSVPSRVDIEITGMPPGELKDLPLGAPAPGESAPPQRPRVSAPATVDKGGALAAKEERAARAGQGDAEEEGGAGVSDLRELGPEGSRFTMLLRVDRLKGTPYADSVDTLLMRMPDRRDLLEGTGLGLYDDFEALLVSTPNPRDYRVTFLAARHHVGDGAMRAAIDRGARATGRVISWRTEGRRPWGERRARAGATADGAPPTRDERLIVLPAPGLVVVTPPAYRALLLAPARKPGGAADGGVEDGGVAPAPAPSWTSLLRRIDAEDGLLGPHDVAMVTAVDLFKRGGGAPLAFLGVALEVPRLLKAVLGAAPDPYLELTGEFAEEAAARRFEASWPVLHRKLRGNPYVVLGGFATILGRVTAIREGSVVKLRVTASPEETVRLLQLAASALPG